MKIKSNKTKLILFLYSLFITILMIGLSIAFMQFVTPTGSGNLPNVLLIPNEEEVIKSIIESPDSSVGPNSFTGILNIESIDEYYRDEFLKYLPIMLITILLIISLGTWVLWKFIKRENSNQANSLANDLTTMESSSEINITDDRINRAYDDVKTKMDEFNNDFMKLTSYITHEQKNALTKLKVKAETTGESVINEIDEMRSSLDDILTLSATHRMDHNEPVDVAFLCAKICDDYKKVHNNIYFEFDEEYSMIVSGNELWIERAISNLVDNAIKYGMGSDVRVTVKSKKGSIIVIIADKGIGISEEQQSKVFENRYRINKLKKDGYGIGLSLVQHVCDLCSGYLWIDSQEGNGSKFYMAFPQVLTLD